MSNDSNNKQSHHVNFSPKPPVKWAGGKAQLLSQFEPLFPNNFELYLEPFLGGGAVFFHLLPKKAVLIDNNEELVNLFQVIRDNLAELLKSLGEHKNTPEYFYEIRAADVNKLTRVERASRFLYLNKTAYNGLYRVNRKNQFNVPFGYYKNPRIKDDFNLNQVKEALKGAEIICGDFTLALEYVKDNTYVNENTFVKDNTFVYLDPPYNPLSETSKFTGYTSKGFDSDAQKRLASLFYELDKKGCWVMLSNSDTPLIHDLYQGYIIDKVYARRAVNCKAEKRGPIAELVIRNYD